MSKGILATTMVVAALFVGRTEGWAQSLEPEIVVTANRLEEMARDFVDQVAIAPRGERQIARWDGRICPLVAGLSGRHAQYIVDRIAWRAHQNGLETEAPGCGANMLIFITPDPARLAGEIVNRYRRVVGYYSTPGVTTLGRGLLEEFASTPAPVRWWHVNQTLSADGQSLVSENGGLPVLRTTLPSARVQRATRQEFLRVLIIVDARQANGVALQPLADYLAMVGLSQLAPSSDTSSVPTILNLFDENSPPLALNAMTAWDEAFLDGLYHARATAPLDTWQRRDITRHMVETLEGVAEH